MLKQQRMYMRIRNPIYVYVGDIKIVEHFNFACSSMGYFEFMKGHRCNWCEYMEGVNIINMWENVIPSFVIKIRIRRKLCKLQTPLSLWLYDQKKNKLYHEQTFNLLFECIVIYLCWAIFRRKFYWKLCLFGILLF